MSDTLFGEPTEMQGAAIISDDGLYRYGLVRRWDRDNASVATFIMLNPSTADATNDDPTIRRCIAFARRWGMGGLHVLNLYAYRASKPADLWQAEDPVGPENDRHLTDHMATLGPHLPVVAAWGNNARQDRIDHLMALPGARWLKCLGTTGSGAPKHPLARGKHRVPDDVVLAPWPWRTAP